MTHEDVTFSSDEIGEIFGSLTVAKKEGPKIQAQRTETAPARETKTPAVLDRSSEMDKPGRRDINAGGEVPDTDVDELVRRAEEIEREEKKDVPAPDAKGVEPARVLEFFEEIRKFMVSELELKIDRKILENMMLRTLEKTAASHRVLKNTNWGADGNLRLNGAIDTATMIKNMGLCPDKNIANQTAAEALSALLYLRLCSVKQGLGAEVYSALSGMLVKKTGIIEAGYGAGTAFYFKNNILKSAISKGDELK